MELKEAIRKVRGTMSLREFGAAFGASKTAAAKWLNGQSKPSPDKLEDMGIVHRETYDLKDAR